MAKLGEKRVRILLGVAVALVVIIFALVFFQFPDNTHANFTFSAPDENSCVKVTGYTGNPTTLNIPSTDKDGHKVIAVAESAFSGAAGYDRVEKVKIPNTVTVIEKDAFNGLPNLEVVDLSSNLVTIGDEAFAECVQLDTIEFPDTLETIGASAFDRCINLKRMYIPASVEEIGPQAFVPTVILDVSDNPYAAERAVAENWETGTVDTTAIYLIVILSITVVGTVLVVFVWHQIKQKRENKNKTE